MFNNGEVYIRGYNLRHQTDHRTIKVDPTTTNTKYRSKNIRFVKGPKHGTRYMVLNLPNYGPPRGSNSIAYIGYRNSVDIQGCTDKVSSAVMHIRAYQMVNYYAHTIQLLMRRFVEKRKNERAIVIEYLLQQQNELNYLSNEYVLRNILTFGR